MATNLLLWLLAVTNDSIHKEIESELKPLRAFEGKTHFYSYLKEEEKNRQDGKHAAFSTQSRTSIFPPRFPILFFFLEDPSDHILLKERWQTKVIGAPRFVRLPHSKAIGNTEK